MDFVAIDFETANEQRGSACEVGLVKVIDGSVVDTFSTLIKPHPSMKFNPWNIQIHGITPSDVRSAPEFPEIFSELMDFSGDLPFLAHSAGFDMGVLLKSASLYGISLPQKDYFCTRVLARQSTAIELPSYTLANVCYELGISFIESHRAKADAEACAQVGLKLAERETARSMPELAVKLMVRPGSVSGSVLSGTRSKSRKFPSSWSKRDAAAFLSSIGEDEMRFDDDFQGKEVIFTGALTSMERKVAQEKVLLAGGTTGNNVTKKTSIVVVGAPYDSELQPGGQISGKLRKVIELRNDGLAIEILTESEFLELFEN